MSRVGKQPIVVPEGVEVVVDGSQVMVRGSRGELGFDLPHCVIVAQEDNVVRVTVKSPESDRAFWGLWRRLLANAVIGVSEGFMQELELVGLGYRVKAEGQDLVLSLGLSHSVPFPAPEGIQFEVLGDTRIKVAGIDKQLVNMTAARIRDLKKPEPYKGKGIRYAGEVIRRKAGKAAKAEGFGE